MGSETTHPSLLERVRDLDDQASWREFDEKYRELVLRYCRRYGLQPSDAEDVRQIVMMSLVRSSSNLVYRPELGRFRDYLGTVVRNAIRKRMSREDRHRAVLPLEGLDVPDPSEECDEIWQREWMLHHYRRALCIVGKVVSPRSVAVFRGILDGVPFEELAGEHSIGLDAVLKIQQRMRTRLTEQVARQLEDEEFPALRDGSSLDRGGHHGRESPDSTPSA